MIDILTYDLSLPNLDKDIDKYMRTIFITKVTDAFKAGGYGKIKDGDDREGGNFLVGVSGRLFEVQGDFSVLNVDVFGTSVGCGRQAARGSLHSTYKLVKDPETRVLMALKAAEELCIGVRRPFKIVDTKK
jgi:hypothetical protein